MKAWRAKRVPIRAWPAVSGVQEIRQRCSGEVRFVVEVEPVEVVEVGVIGHAFGRYARKFLADGAQGEESGDGGDWRRRGRRTS